MSAAHSENLLSTELAGIELRNPVLLAAGTAGYVDEMEDVMRLREVGGVVTKSITAEPRGGNPTWRIIETERGMMNAIGLANVGVERFIEEHAPRAADVDAVVFGSIAGDSIEGYVEVARAMERVAALPAVELNVSCPNVRAGASFGESPELLRELIDAVRAELEQTRLFVKLPPLLTSREGASMVDVARSALDAGADGLCVCNTIPALAIDVESRRPRLANGTGGLSGPALHPIAVRLVREVYERVAASRQTPIIGVGGVLHWRDAAELILAGASAVEMGTALFIDPRSPRRVLRGLESWVRRQGASSLSELIGAMGDAEPAT